MMRRTFLWMEKVKKTTGLSLKPLLKWDSVRAVNDKIKMPMMTGFAKKKD